MDGYDATLLAPGVISTGDVFASSLTPDGRTVYFTRATMDRARMQIMRSTWRNGAWSAPERAPFSTGTRQMDPHVTPDGERVYFTAPRRREATLADPDGDWDTWWARIDGKEDPTVATRVPGLANTDANEMYPSVAVDLTLVWGWRPRGTNPPPGELRYWHRRLRTDPVAIGLGNSVSNPSNPYLTPNGRVLIFSATGADPRRRNDLFVSRRGGDGRWSAPVNLGLAVNTIDTEFCPQLSPDGQYLFFSRVRYDGDRATGNDIYVIRVAGVPALVEALGTPSSELRAPSSEFRVPSSEFRTPNSEFRVPSSEFGVPSSEFRVPSSEFRVRSSEFGVRSSEFRVPSSEFRVPSSESAFRPASRDDSSRSLHRLAHSCA